MTATDDAFESFSEDIMKNNNKSWENEKRFECNIYAHLSVQQIPTLDLGRKQQKSAANSKFDKFSN